MPTNIESFVKTLESEGVEAGKKAAQKIEAEAREKAETIISEAKETSNQIIADAHAEAEKVQTRMNSSLQLATRDTILMLREKLSQQLEIILKSNVEKALNEEETLVSVLREVIPAYAKADTRKELKTKINVSANVKSKLLETALGELANSLKSRNIQMDVAQSLAKSGFEFKIEGSTVEVSTDSVTSLLAEMIDPDLQQFLAKAENTHPEDNSAN